MLALAGVTRDTPDPMPGVSYFQRDPATGEPTGFLLEPPAMLSVNNAVSPFTTDYVIEALEEWLPKLIRTVPCLDGPPDPCNLQTQNLRATAQVTTDRHARQ